VRQTLVLGRLFGVRIGVHVSWLAVYAFVTYALTRALAALPPAQAWLCGAVGSLALFASVLAHELAHALVARRFGVRTDGITLFLLGGVATLAEEPRTPRADALIALAGPALSGILAVLAFGLQIAVDRAVPGPAGDAFALLATYIFLANAVLAVFNLLPAYPMDGGRVLRALLWHRRVRAHRPAATFLAGRDAATAAAARVGVVFAIGFVAAGVLAAAATRDFVYGWYAVLGAFLLRQSWVQATDAGAAARGAGVAEIGAAA